MKSALGLILAIIAGIAFAAAYAFAVRAGAGWLDVATRCISSRFGHPCGAARGVEHGGVNITGRVLGRDVAPVSRVKQECNCITIFVLVP